MNTRLRILILILFLSTPFSLYSNTLQDAVDEAAQYFVKQAVKIQPDQELHIIEILNYNSLKNDDKAKRIETELYFAFERQRPDFKLFLGKGSDKAKEIYLNGIYEQKSNEVFLYLKIFKGNELIAQKKVVFRNEDTRRRTLVAVLDIEAEFLSKSQRKAYSDILRSRLIKINTFDLTSSADVDRMNPDEIQKATGCTRDACATIIGEQLGVDRVISSSIFMLGNENYIISAKLLDIKDGSIITSETVNHTEYIRTIEKSLNVLAHKIAGDSRQVETHEEKRKTSMGWHIAAISLTLASIYVSNQEFKDYKSLSDKNKDINELYNESYSIKERTTLQKEFDINYDKMQSHKTNVQIADVMTVLMLLWEVYLLWPSDDEDIYSFKTNDNVNFIPRYIVYKDIDGFKSHFSWMFEFKF